MPTIKPGYKTTEFWTVIGMWAITLAKVTGYLDPTDVGDVTAHWENIVVSVASGLGSVMYISGRVKVKNGK